MVFVAVTLPGLEGLTVTLAWEKGLIAKPLDCRARVLIEEDWDRLDDILSIETLEAIYYLMGTWRLEQGSGWRQRFRRWIRGLMKRLRRRVTVRGGCVFVHVVCFHCGLPWRKLREYAVLAAREAQRVLGLTPVSRPGRRSCLVIRLEACRDTFYAGVELARGLHRRWYLQESIPALLNPLAAAAAAAYAGVEGRLVADLYAGGVTLGIEAGLRGARYVVAVEVNDSILARGFRHVKNAYLDHLIDVVVADARYTPFRRVEVCLADPPRGRRVRGFFNPKGFREVCRRLVVVAPRWSLRNGEVLCNVMTGWGWLSIYLFDEMA